MSPSHQMLKINSYLSGFNYWSSTTWIMSSESLFMGLMLSNRHMRQWLISNFAAIFFLASGLKSWTPWACSEITCKFSKKKTVWPTTITSVSLDLPSGSKIEWPFISGFWSFWFQNYFLGYKAQYSGEFGYENYKAADPMETASQPLPPHATRGIPNHVFAARSSELITVQGDKGAGAE